MAQVTITVPPALVPRVRAAMRATFPELSQLADAAAFQEATAKMWRGVVHSYEMSLRDDGVAQAATAASAAIDTDTTGIA